ncbi:FAD-dependent thymidylate synthase [Clostridiales bacterium FE2011]|nr:FAD-dependent thymidylate synthase [Clostridiales bacterium FE2011]
MKIIKPSFVIEEELDGNKIIKKIEQYGRTCYKSEDRISEESAKRFIQNILKRGHESVIEHEKITVRVVCDRGVSHEIVRHRLASYSQESTRYCNYSNAKFGAELTFILPVFWENEDRKKELELWKKAMENAEKSYFALLEAGAEPQEARSVLPNSLKTEIVMTMNLREWRHFFRLRTSEAAHPQMRQIAQAILFEFRKKVPIIFDDI